MLRDVIVHINNEQPIIVDLVAEPSPSDVALLCRNVRTANGKKPVFIDEADSTFLMPLAAIRFVEIHRSSVEAHQAEQAAEAAAAAFAEPIEPALTNGALARLDWDRDAVALDAAVAEVPGSVLGTDPAISDELDDDLLRRIREA
jgi:hypothetical protein